jgi:phosphoserine aminotransferase
MTIVSSKTSPVLGKLAGYYTVDMPEIQIPSQLLPKDGRFGCGPSRLRPEQIAAFGAQGSLLMGTSHRQAPIKNLVKEVQNGLIDLFRSPTGYEIVLGNGGSTAFWDMAAYSLADGNSQALVHGEFSSKFAKSLKAPFLGELSIQKGEPGSRSEFVATSLTSTYVYPQNETSTGVITPVERLAGVDSGALFLTDATSAAGGMDFEAGNTDVYYFAPQKNFAADGGIWFALMSPAAVARAEKIAESDRYIPEFLSLKTAITNSRLNQTLNTPAIGTLFLLNEQIKWINESGGLKWADAKTKASSKVLYDWAEASGVASPFVTNPDHRSQVVATLEFDSSVDSVELIRVLRANGIVDVDPYRGMGKNQLRIATFVGTEQADVEALTACIDFVLERLA